MTDPAFEPESYDERDLLEQTKFYRYATNSGTAAGLTRDEAILHGLLELIERDALGLTFIKCIVSPNPHAVREIQHETLPESSSYLVGNAARESGGELTLWDITSDVSIPCALCAIAIGGSHKYRFFGSGASLFRDYAIERAVLEALQGYHIQNALGVRLTCPLSSDHA